MSHLTSPSPCVATVGTFDGVHRGHQHLIASLAAEARQRGMTSLAVTFRQHPRQVLWPHSHPQMLTLAEEKAALLRAAGADRVVLLDFTPQLAQMPAAAFMRQVLKARLGVQVLMVGYDNHIGHGGGSLSDYVKWGADTGVEVLECGKWGDPCSSTHIRALLQEGHIRQANHLLGRHYSLEGTVVKGFQNGRKLGYPTANLRLDARKLLPASGAYMVQTARGNGMLNIGTRPTLRGSAALSVEVHIFDLDADLYGQTLTVSLLRRLRPERQFSTLEALRRQLAHDEAACRSFFKDVTCKM